MVSLHDYELDLPSQMKVHPVFNTCNLKPHHGPVPNPISGELPSHIIEGVEEWEVGSIVDERPREYLVRWKGYPDPTWEPRKNLQNTPEVAQKWKKNHSNQNH